MSDLSKHIKSCDAWLATHPLEAWEETEETSRLVDITLGEIAELPFRSDRALRSMAREADIYVFARVAIARELAIRGIEHPITINLEPAK